MTEMIARVLIVAGLLFFAAGTLGLLRFPDVYSRLHALTKADNLGLGLVLVGSALRSGSLAVALKLALIWLLALVSSATSAYLISNAAVRLDIEPKVNP